MKRLAWLIMIICLIGIIMMGGACTKQSPYDYPRIPNCDVRWINITDDSVMVYSDCGSAFWVPQHDTIDGMNNTFNYHYKAYKGRNELVGEGTASYNNIIK